MANQLIITRALLNDVDYGAARAHLALLWRAERPYFRTWERLPEGETGADGKDYVDVLENELAPLEPVEVQRLRDLGLDRAHCRERSTCGSCKGSGWYWQWDDDHPCGCHPQAALGAAIGTFFSRAILLQERLPVVRAMEGLEALAAIGAQIDRAMEPGRAVVRFISRAHHAAGEVGRRLAKFFGNITRFYNEVQVGRCYQVTGKRGRAKERFGIIGVALRLEQDDYGTEVVQLQPIIDPNDDEAEPRGDRRKPFRVSIGSVSPVPTLSVAQPIIEKALGRKKRLERPRFNGGKGDWAYVIDGPHAGKSGRVFWVQDYAQARDGVRRYGLRMETREAQEKLVELKAAAGRKGKVDWKLMDPWTLWVDACDLADAPMPHMDEDTLGKWMTTNAPEVLDMVEMHVQMFCRVLQWAAAWKEPGGLKREEKPAIVAQRLPRAALRAPVVQPSMKERQAIKVVGVETCVHGVSLRPEGHLVSAVLCCARCAKLQEGK